MKKVKETKRIQLVCPHCKHEFKYNTDYVSKKIDELGMEIKNIQTQLANHRKRTKEEQYERTEWYFKTKSALAIKSNQLLELKTYRKTSNQLIKEQEYDVFKSIIKEKFGNEVFMECIGLMEEEMAQYNIASTSKTGFTRSNGKNIISINNL